VPYPFPRLLNLNFWISLRKTFGVTINLFPELAGLWVSGLQWTLTSGLQESKSGVRTSLMLIFNFLESSQVKFNTNKSDSKVDTSQLCVFRLYCALIYWFSVLTNNFRRVIFKLQRNLEIEFDKIGSVDQSTHNLIFLCHIKTSHVCVCLYT